MPPPGEEGWRPEDRGAQHKAAFGGRREDAAVTWRSRSALDPVLGPWGCKGLEDGLWVQAALLGRLEPGKQGGKWSSGMRPHL